MLSGDNSILSKATQAKTQTENKSGEEQIKLQVMGSIGIDGKIDVAILKTNLGKIGATATGNSLPLTVTSGEQQFIIDSNGVVTLMKPVTLEAILGWIGNDDVCKDEGKPVTLSTSFGNFSNDLLEVIVTFDENDNLVFDSMYIYPPFNANCILKYSYEGKVTSVQWLD